MIITETVSLRVFLITVFYDFLHRN